MQAAGLIDVHDEIGDIAVILGAPMPVARRLSLEIDGLRDGERRIEGKQPSLVMHMCISLTR